MQPLTFIAGALCVVVTISAPTKFASRRETNSPTKKVAKRSGEYSETTDNAIYSPDAYYDPRQKSWGSGADAECIDNNDQCVGWAAVGECGESSAYMIQNCCKSCRVLTAFLEQGTRASAVNSRQDTATVDTPATDPSMMGLEVLNGFLPIIDLLLIAFTANAQMMQQATVSIEKTRTNSICSMSRSMGNMNVAPDPAPALLGTTASCDDTSGGAGAGAACAAAIKSLQIHLNLLVSQMNDVSAPSC